MFTILLRSTLLDTNLLCDTFLLVLCQHLFRFSLSFQVHQFPFLSRRKARSVLRKNSDFTVHKNDSFKCYGKISQLSPQKRNQWTTISSPKKLHFVIYTSVIITLHLCFNSDFPEITAYSLLNGSLCDPSHN